MTLEEANARIDWLRLQLLEHGVEVPLPTTPVLSLEAARLRITKLMTAFREHGLTVDEPLLLREEHVDEFLARAFTEIERIRAAPVRRRLLPALAQ